MKLENKKAFAARALDVGLKRIVFNTQRLAEIKEAITKQDIRDLKNSGAIVIKGKKGHLTKKKRKTRRRAGSIKKRVNTRKRDYLTLARKLRTHLANLKKRNQLDSEKITKLRKEIRASIFKSLAHMKERINQIKEEN